MNKEQVIAKFTTNPTYLENGSGTLAERWNTTKEIIKEAKAHVRALNDVVTGVYIGHLENALEQALKNVDCVKGTMESKVSSSFEPKSHEELYDLHKIDRNEYVITNYWTKQLPNSKFTSSVFCKKKSIETNPELQKEILLKEFKSYESSVLESFNYFTSSLMQERKNTGDCLLELSLPDIHVGKLSHRDETGEDYDIKIAVERYKTAIRELLATSNLSSIGRIILPIGNDLLHVNSEDNMTVAGTPQDCDSRFHKMVQAAKIMLIDVITGLSAIAPVDVIVIKGNHDATATFMLGEILDAFFHNNPLVQINNSPSWRKYYKFGLNSFLYSHGDKEKHNDLGLIFATEESQLWAETKFRFAKLGHLHKTKTTNYVATNTGIGFQVQILPSLSATDEWHSGKGYIGLKQAKGFLYHPTKGEIAQYTYTV